MQAPRRHFEKELPAQNGPELVCYLNRIFRYKLIWQNKGRREHISWYILCSDSSKHFIKFSRKQQSQDFQAPNNARKHAC